MIIKTEIYTPKGMELETEAVAIIVPTRSGEISVLPRHVPIISVLKPGKMIIKTAQKDIERKIEGGILEVTEDKVTLLLKKF